MRVLKLIIGEDENCLLCKHPHGPIPKEIKLPWLLCPTHYGDLSDDPEIAAINDLAAHLEDDEEICELSRLVKK